MATENQPPPQGKFDDQTVKLYVGGINPQWDSDHLKKILGEEGIKRVDIVNNYAFAVS